MVVSLLVLLALGVIQVVLVAHVRDVLTADAADAARYAARAGRDPATGGAYARTAIGESLSRSLSDAMTCTGRRTTDPASGLATVEVRCAGEVPLRLLPFTSLHLGVTGHAVAEAG